MGSDGMVNKVKGRVLVACEFSGLVRSAFASVGWDAWSCDLLDTEIPGQHFKCDVREVVGQQWDMMICFPPCTFLCSSGMHWTVRGKRDPQLTEDALDFVRLLLDAPIEHIAIENPVGCISTRIRKPDQIIHPWQYGHPESKTTCLWLKNLPPLQPTNILTKPASGRWENQCANGSQNKLGPSPDRWKLRSKTYECIAAAMAAQWTEYLSCAPATCQTASAVVKSGAQLTMSTMLTAPVSGRTTPKNSDTM
jgi:hypothetical protein